MSQKWLWLSTYTREGNGTPLQYSCLANPTDGGAWWAAVHEVAKSRTRLSDFTFTFHFHALEKEMATHSSILAWRIPGTGEPDGLPSVGSHRVGHDWSDLAVASTYTPIFLVPVSLFIVFGFKYVKNNSQVWLKLSFFSVISSLKKLKITVGRKYQIYMHIYSLLLGHLPLLQN